MRNVLLCLTWLAGPALAGPVDDARLDYLAGDHAAALAVLRPAAEAGDPNAQNILGDAYDGGNGVEVDYAAAIEWWERSAAQGFDKAQFNLALLYEHGRPGIAPDYERAALRYAEAMENGNPTAPTNLGFLYESGVIDEGLIDDGHDHDHGQEGADERAAELYAIGAERGDAQGMNNLATMYVQARGVDEDMARAISLYREAAAQGHPGAISNLGAMYENGYGVAVDPLAAFALYSVGARGGHAQAAVNIAWMLADGTAPGGTPEDAALPLAYCYWGMSLDPGGAGDPEAEGFAADCEAIAIDLPEEARARARELAEGLGGARAD